MKQGTDAIRMGILGTGWIAHKMAQSLDHASLCIMSAVGSREIQRSREFANTYANSPGCNGKQPHVWGSYEELVNDPTIDLVYVASPHSHHYEHTMLALRAGKHVLVEKAFAMNAGQAKLMIEEARSRKLFLMEAMWTRYIPAVRRARDLISDGAIGTLRTIQADLGFVFPFDPNHRLFNPQLGGGAMLDLGIYPLSIACFFAGLPIKVQSVSTLSQTGVDASTAFSMEHSQGVVSSCACTSGALSSCTAFFSGEKGTLSFGPTFHNAGSLTLSQGGYRGTSETIDLPFPGPGYHFEADEAAFCIREGKLESPDMSLDESLELCRIMDGILETAGVRYQID